MAPTSKKSVKNGGMGGEKPKTVTPSKEDSKRLQETQQRKKEQQEEWKKRKEAKRA